MTRSYRIYRQDVLAELPDGELIIDESYIDGDLPSTDDEITLVGLDGSESQMQFVSWRLGIRPKASPEVARELTEEERAATIAKLQAPIR